MSAVMVIILELVKLEADPTTLFNNLPVPFIEENNIEEGHGFSDKVLSLEDGEIQFEISYDGESELLAKLIKKPETLSTEYAENILRDALNSSLD